MRDARVKTELLCLNKTSEPTLDSIDAALAAATAHMAMHGNFTVVGDDHEWIVVPGSRHERFTGGDH